MRRSDSARSGSRSSSASQKSGYTIDEGVDDMGQRVAGKVAVVVGAGQTPGQTDGNGGRRPCCSRGRAPWCSRPTAISRAAQATVAEIEAEGGKALAVQADVTDEDAVAAIGRHVRRALRPDRHPAQQRRRRASRAATPRSPRSTADAFARDHGDQPQGMVAHLQARHPRDARAGRRRDRQHLVDRGDSIDYPYIAYQHVQGGRGALTEHLAIRNARVRHPRQRDPARPHGHADGDREPRRARRRHARAGDRRAQRRTCRSRNKMGTAWDVAHAALFLASDEAAFITGVALAVDGGQSLAVG